MANQQFSVNLALTADASQARAQLQGLQKQLTDLINTTSKSSNSLGLSKEIQEATGKVAQLKAQLESATSSSGKLDLTKFNDSLNASGMKLSQYREALISLGSDGEKAFSALANSISQADVPIRRTSALLNDFAVTLKNTAKWQISSNVIHGLQGALQSAFGYAQDLNESLTNIRIVTGQTADQMAAFAERANKSAQALSTTTTAYTDAALIFYQQGLDDKAVEERTNAVIKMAHATGDSATEVSSYMTAIWNNFDEGSHTLEHYADVITALGAATASSSSEISEGISKFASVAETAGLSYEYATSALATVVATTRQSADTVGTAFKTLFARIQDLELGKTLEDGTDLGQYSLALQKVGVDIKDASGELKDMDTILDELGAKWELLSDDTKIATAQAVAGTRQYTQLMALMDNWDFMQRNVSIAENSDGTLTEQANIYAQGWEAARDRVTAAAEQIYGQLLNPDFFIDFNNGLANVLNKINDLIKGMGGIKGVLSSLGMIFTSVFEQQIAQGINNFTNNLKMAFGGGKDEIEKLRNEAKQLEIENQVNGLKRVAGAAAGDAYEANARAQDLLLSKAKELTAEEQRAAQIILSQNQALADQVRMDGEALQFSKEKTAQEERRLRVLTNNDSDVQKQRGKLQTAVDLESKTNAARSFVSNTADSMDASNVQSKVDQINTYMQQLEARAKEAGQTLEQYLGAGAAKAFEQFKNSTASGEQKIKDLSNALDKIGQSMSQSTEKKIEDLAQAIQKVTGIDIAAAREAALNIAQQYQDTSEKTRDLEENTTRLGGAFGTLEVFLKSAVGPLSSLGGALVKAAQVSTSVVTGINSLSSGLSAASKIFENGSLSVSNLTSAVGGLGMGVTALAKIVTTFGATNPLGWILAGATTVLSILKMKQQAEEEEKKARAEDFKASEEAYWANNELMKSNQELVHSYSEAIAAYDGSETSKEKLNSLTEELINTYNLEGDALARLRGEYEDYDNILQQATAHNKKLLEEQLKDTEEELKKAERQIKDAANVAQDAEGQKARKSYTFTGHNNDDRQVADLLRSDKDLKSLQTEIYDGYGGVFGDEFSFKININYSDMDQVIDRYHQLDHAVKLLETSNLNLSESGIYEDLVKQRDALQESVEAYEALDREASMLRIQTAQTGLNIISDTDIHNVEDYIKWTQQVTDYLTQEGYAAEDVEEAIDSLVKTSLNPDLDGFKNIADSLDQVKELNPQLVEEYGDVLQEVFGEAANDEIKQSALGMLNWSTITAESFQTAYESAQRYLAAKEQLANSSMLMDQGFKLQEDYDKSKGNLTSKTISTLQDDIDWGSTFQLDGAEKEIIAFDDFLKMTSTERANYIKQLNADLQESTKQQAEIVKAAALDAKTEAEGLLKDDRYSDENVSKAQDLVDGWNQVIQTYKDYKAAQEEGIDYEIPEEVTQFLDAQGKSWEIIVSMEEEGKDVEEEIQNLEEYSEAGVTIKTRTDLDETIAQAETDIDNADLTLTVIEVTEDEKVRAAIQELETKEIKIGVTFDIDQQKGLGELFKGNDKAAQELNSYIETAEDGSWEIVRNAQEANDLIQTQIALRAAANEEEFTAGVAAAKTRNALLQIKDDDAFNKALEDAIALNPALEADREMIQAMRDANDDTNDSFDRLIELAGSGYIEADKLASRMDKVLNNPEIGTQEKIEELNGALEAGIYTADQYKTKLDSLLNASGLTTSQKIGEIDKASSQLDSEGNRVYSDIEIRQKKVDTYKNADDMSDAQRMASIQEQLDLSTSIEEANQYKQILASIIQSSDQMYDDQKISQLADLWANDADHAYEYQQAILAVVNSSNNMTTDEKIKAINDAFGELSPDEFKAYGDAITEIIANDDSLTTEEKLAKIEELLGDTGVLEYYDDLIVKIICSDANTTTAEKIAELNRLLAEGKVNAKDYGKNLLDVLQNSDLNVEEQKTALSENESQFTGTKPDLEQYNKFSDMPSYIKDMVDYQSGMKEYIDTYQNFINSLSGSDFENLDMWDNVFDDIPKGVEYVKQAEQTLLEYASQYESCANDVARAKELMEQNPESEATQDAMHDVELMARSEDIAKAYGLQAQEVQEVAKAMNELAEAGEEGYESIQGDAEAATDAARRYLRLNDAVEDLKENYDDYADELKKIQKTTNSVDKAMAANSKTALKMRSSIANLIDTSEDLIDTKMLDAIDPDDFEKAARGDEDAIGRIRDAFIDAQADAYGFADVAQEVKDELAGLDDGAVIDLDNSPAIMAMVEAMVQAGATADEIKSALSGMGIDCDVTPFLGSMAEMEAASAAAGSAVIENASFDAEVNELDQDLTSTKQDVGFDEQISWTDNPRTAMVAENEASEAKEVELNIPSATKTVTPKVETETEESEQKVAGVKLSNAHKSAGGNVSANNKGGGGGGGGRGGGGRRGGGGGRAARRNTAAKKEEKKDRYHVVNKTLSDMERQLDKINKAKNRAFGASKVKLMQKEIDKQKELIKVQKEYLKQIKENLKLDKKNLNRGTTTYTDSNGKDRTINVGAENYLGKKVDYQDGQIMNYDELMAANEAKLEAARKKFNQANTDDEKAKEAWAIAQVQYEKFKEYLDQYEETQELYLDRQQEILDAENELYDKYLEKTQYKVNVKLEVNEDELKIIEYRLKRLQDLSFSTARQIANIGDQTANSLEKININREGMKGIFNNHGMDGEKIIASMQNGTFDPKSIKEGEFTEAEIEQLREWSNEILAETERLAELRDQIRETVKNGFDEYAEALDKNNRKISHLQNVTQSYMNIVDILGKKKLNINTQWIKDISQAQVHQAQNKLEASKSKYEGLQAYYEGLKKIDTSKMSQEEKEKWSKTIGEIGEQVDAAREEFQSSWEEALQAAADAFSKTMESIIDDMTDKMGGLAGSLSTLSDAYEKQTDIDAQYLEDFRQIYELSKLTRQINNSIDDTDNIKGKQELKKLLEEINQIQEEGTQLSEYDLEYLQKRYNLKVAELALDEAKEAKSTVQLTQNNEGNYSYVYTANDADVQSAEQQYEDKLYEMQRLNADYINELQQNILDMEQSLADELANIDITMFATTEAYQAEVDRITAYYNEKMGFYHGEMDKVLTNNKTLYTEDWQKYSEMHDYKISADEKYVDSFNETSLSTLTGFQTMEKFHENFNNTVFGGDPNNPSSSSAIGQAIEAFQTYSGNVDTTMGLAGTSVEDFANDVKDEVDNEIIPASDRAKDDSEALKNKIAEDINVIVAAIENWYDMYNQRVDEMLSKNEKLAASFNSLVREMTQFEISTREEDKPDNNQGGTENNEPAQPQQPNKPNKTPDAKTKYGVALAIWNGNYGWGEDPGRAAKLKQKFGPNNGIQAIVNKLGNEGLVYSGAWVGHYYGIKNLAPYAYSKFDTGGYTGQWNSKEGKMAMLHEKELVLNKDDTQNILSAVEMIRKISQTIDLNAIAASSALNSMGLNSVHGAQTGDMVQNITIEADFSGVQSAAEIQQAFNNIVNMASQYANRK